MINTVARFTKRLIRDDSGQDMVEYVLIFALVSIIALAAVTAAGQSVLTLWTTISGGLPAI